MGARIRRSFTEDYDRYDPAAEGFGSQDDWEAAAERLATGRGRLRGRQRRNADLDALGLDAMPSTIDLLKAAFRAAVKVAHPDTGGSAAAFKRVFAAYERLVRNY